MNEEFLKVLASLNPDNIKLTLKDLQEAETWFNLGFEAGSKSNDEPLGVKYVKPLIWSEWINWEKEYAKSPGIDPASWFDVSDNELVEVVFRDDKTTSIGKVRDFSWDIENTADDIVKLRFEAT